MNKNKFFKYTACRRRDETYTKRSNYIILQEKKNNGIIQKETKLSNFKSRTTYKTRSNKKNRNTKNNE